MKRLMKMPELSKTCTEQYQKCALSLQVWSWKEATMKTYKSNTIWERIFACDFFYWDMTLIQKSMEMHLKSVQSYLKVSSLPTSTWQSLSLPPSGTAFSSHSEAVEASTNAIWWQRMYSRSLDAQSLVTSPKTLSISWGVICLKKRKFLISSWIYQNLLTIIT